MRTLPQFVFLLLATPGVLGGQQVNPVSEAFRAYQRAMRANLLAVAEGLSPAEYAWRPSPSERTFGETVAFTANVTAGYCERLTGRSDSSGFADGPDPRDVLLSRLRAKLDFCQEALRGLTDASLGDTIDLGAPRTRAAGVTEATAFWADQYQQLMSLTRRRGHIPPVPCSGPGGSTHGSILCSSGFSQCVSAPPASRRGQTLVLADAPYGIRSDQRGRYRQDTGNVIAVVVSGTAAFVLADHFVPPQDRRAILVDLDHPVAGADGVPLGLVRDDNNLAIVAQWEADSTRRLRNLAEIPIGSTVRAQMVSVEFHINGVVHLLQFGPVPVGHCFTDGTAVHGRGTTQGTITRPDATTWTVELPTGSIGRLFDVSLRYPFAVDRGLYQVSMRFTIQEGD